MNTRAAILSLGDKLLRERGYNAFSFSDISTVLGVRNASIHYHFPTKGHLAGAIVEAHRGKFNAIKDSVCGCGPLQKLRAFFANYEKIEAEKAMCVIGAFAGSVHSVPQEVQEALRTLAADIHAWVTGVLEEGRRQQRFYFEGDAKVRASQIISNMLAAVQLSRITGNTEVQHIQQTIINDLTQCK